MLYSSTCEYAIRALSHLARQPQGSLTLLADIAEAQELPPPFLSKILKDLVRARMLRSARGRSGGYGLATPPGEITLLQIREVLDGVGDLERCAVGLEPCSDVTQLYKPLRAAIRSYLEQTTVADLARGFEEKRALIDGVTISQRPRRS